MYMNAGSDLSLAPIYTNSNNKNVFSWIKIPQLQIGIDAISKRYTYTKLLRFKRGRF